MALDEKKRLHVGLQVSEWHVGGEPRTLELTAEPSGGVISETLVIAITRSALTQSLSSMCRAQLRDINT